MNEEEEAAARERLKGKIIGPNPIKVHRRGQRRPQVYEVTQPVSTGHMPAPLNVDGWDPNWGAKPRSKYDSDLEWHRGDEEWSPEVSEEKRAMIAGRGRRAELQRDARRERQREKQVTDALRRVQVAELQEQNAVWRSWVVAEVPLTNKQLAFLNDEVELSASSRSQMLGRIQDRVRAQVRAEI